MRFNGEFEIEGVTTEEVWLALSDPCMIKEALPGCAFLVEAGEDPDFDALREEAEAAEDPPILPEATPEEVAERAFERGKTYAALMEVGVGNVKPSFETLATITEREFPRMAVEVEGSAANSSFEMSAWMKLAESDDDVTVTWEAEADIFGRIAQIGARVVNPVANRIVNQFFDEVATRLREAGDADESTDPESLRQRVRSLF
ncbi:CoxG family protein [Natrialbaceae archaeon GCM10025810]|uniref:CoxG family protein n=1 Tax=Halovalidus salilacus TaxID=3075124 RepID=UPI00360D52B7